MRFNKRRYCKICAVTFSVVMIVSALSLFTCSGSPEIETEAENAVEKADEFLSGDFTEKICSAVSSTVKKCIKDFSGVFAGMLFITFVLGIMRTVSDKNGALYAGEICLCAFSFSAVSVMIGNLEEYFSSLEGVMLSALPVMTTLYGASGAPTTATANYATTLTVLNICNILFSSLIIPSVKCITAFSAVSYLSKSFDYSGIQTFIKNTVSWMFGIIMCIISSVIAMRSIISNAKDGFMARTVRFAASRFIPVIGSTVSESARTVSESLRLLRSVSGISSVFAVVAVILPPITALIVCRFFINICGACSGVFSLGKTSAYYKELSGITDLMLGTAVGTAIIFILILGIFAKSYIGI